MSAEPGAGPAAGQGPGAEVLIDASLFLGMHSLDERVRSACKNFFVRHLAARHALAMTLEQVGLCDDLVWRRTREEQDAYYPFMDNLHSELSITRFGFRRGDLAAALDSPGLEGLPLSDALLLAPAVHRGGSLHTASPRLLGRRRLGLPVTAPPDGPELAFPPRLEALYRDSLALRCDLADLDRISSPDDLDTT
ncbi:MULTISPECIES: DUF6190 family protein [Kitasatospora]|uniref:DUF6190 family protein n=1 Tax=Kitasatospora cystarginea TaxID=58350 RepID=A0ABP5RNP4_9ACTN